MSDIAKRLEASIRFDAINGDAHERNVCKRQMAEAVAEINRLTKDLQDERQARERAEGVVTAARAWRANMIHGRDHTDEGYSYAREEDIDALVDAVDALTAPATPSPTRCDKCGGPLTGHEDDSATRCRWCVYAPATPDAADTQAESKEA